MTAPRPRTQAARLRQVSDYVGPTDNLCQFATDHETPQPAEGRRKGGHETLDLGLPTLDLRPQPQTSDLGLTWRPPCRSLEVWGLRVKPVA
jgi:hypothetical protein